MRQKMLNLIKGTGGVFVKCIQYGCIYHCVTTYGVSCVTCDGKSMEPAIYHGDAYIVECLSVHRQKLKRGDIVGVKSMDDPNKYICKRIVAMAGDKVYNDISQERVWVPKGHVWLEGDNKSSSHDSRYYGAVPYGLIFCKLIFRVGGLHGRVVRVADFESLVPHHCVFESHWGLGVFHVRKPSSWLIEGQWFYPSAHSGRK